MTGQSRQGEAERAARIARQHLRTLRFMGIDVAPVHAPASGAGAPRSAQATGSGAEAQHETRPDLVRGVAHDLPRDLPGSQIEGKPGAAASPARAAPKVSPASAYVPIEVPPGELSTEQAQKLLDDVRSAYERDMPHRAFNSTHDNVVFGEGDPRAGLMFVGEAPGETEDQTGRPFVGRAGQLLDKMIVAIGLEREQTYICNVLKVRPPNNATPTPDEAAASAPYLLDQIRIVRPKVIVTLGLPATRLLLGTDQPMRALRGVFAEFPPPSFGTMSGLFSGPWEGDAIPVMPTYHPAYLLRSYTEDNRRKVWQDLKQARAKLD